MSRDRAFTPLRSKKNRFILLGMTEAAAVQFQYRGREISQEDILYIRALIDSHPNESRRRLSTQLCEAWQWRVARHGVPRHAADAGSGRPDRIAAGELHAA